MSYVFNNSVANEYQFKQNEIKENQDIIKKYLNKFKKLFEELYENLDNEDHNSFYSSNEHNVDMQVERERFETFNPQSKLELMKDFKKQSTKSLKNNHSNQISHIDQSKIEENNFDKESNKELFISRNNSNSNKSNRDYNYNNYQILNDNTNAAQEENPLPILNVVRKPLFTTSFSSKINSNVKGTSNHIALQQSNLQLLIKGKIKANQVKKKLKTNLLNATNPYQENKSEEIEEVIESDIVRQKFADLHFQLNDNPYLNVLIDLDHKICFLNDSFCKSLYQNSHECMGKDIKEILDPKDYKSFDSKFTVDQFKSELKVFSRQSNVQSNLNNDSMIHTVEQEKISLIDKQGNSHEYTFESFHVKDSDENYILISFMNQEYKLRPLYILDPREPFQITWCIFITFMIIYLFWQLTYEIAFDTLLKKSTDSFGYYLDICVTFFFFIDIIINFFLAFEDEEYCMMVYDIGKILSNYLRGWFIIDTLATIPINMIFNFGINLYGLKFVKIIKLLRLLRLVKTMNYINLNFLYRNNQFSLEIVRLLQKNMGIMELFKNMIFMLIASHFHVCIQFQIKLVVIEDNDTSWIEQQFDQPIVGKRPLEIQIKMIFESIKTSLGLGVISPVNTIETVITSVWMFIGLAMFGQGIGNISSQLNTANKRENIYSDTVAFFKDICMEHNVDNKLRTAILKEVEDYQDNQQIQEQKENGVLLSKNTKYRLDSTIYKAFIKSFNLFPHLKIETVQALKQCKLLDRKNVISKGEEITEVYFVFKGSVLVFDDDLQAINHFNPSEIMGLTEFNYFHHAKHGKMFKPTYSQAQSWQPTLPHDPATLDHPEDTDEHEDLLAGYYFRQQGQAVAEDGTQQLAVSQQVLLDIIENDRFSFTKMWKYYCQQYEPMDADDIQQSNHLQSDFEDNPLPGLMVSDKNIIYNINYEMAAKLKVSNLAGKTLNELILDLESHEEDNEMFYKLHKVYSLLANDKLHQSKLVKVNNGRIARILPQEKRNNYRDQYCLKKCMKNVFIMQQEFMD